MAKFDTSMSTGIARLDEVIQGVRPGDNIVWKLDSIEDYLTYVHPFCLEAADHKRGHEAFVEIHSSYRNNHPIPDEAARYTGQR